MLAGIWDLEDGDQDEGVCFDKSVLVAGTEAAPKLPQQQRKGVCPTMRYNYF